MRRRPSTRCIDTPASRYFVGGTPALYGKPATLVAYDGSGRVVAREKLGITRAQG